MANVYQIYNLKRKIADHIGIEKANHFIPDEYLNGDNKTAKQKAQIMNAILEKMDYELDISVIKNIRRNTSCNITKNQMEIIDCSKNKTNIQVEQCEIINAGIAPSKIEMLGNKYIFRFGYGKCICRMFSKIENPKSFRSFCYCCAGNIEKLLGYWLEKTIEVELENSHLLGNKDCVFGSINEET